MSESQCWAIIRKLLTFLYSILLLGAKFFGGSLLNFAENLLKFRDDKPAIIFKGETSKKQVVLTYKELYQKVAHLSSALATLGVEAGDRVACYTPNMPEAVIAMLAATRYVHGNFYSSQRKS